MARICKKHMSVCEYMYKREYIYIYIYIYIHINVYICLFIYLTGKPGMLQSTGSWRVGRDLATGKQQYIYSFPGGLAGKDSTCNAGDLGLMPRLGRSPGGGHGNPFQYSCLENTHGQRSLAGYSSWGCKESDMTEQLSTCIYVCAYMCIHT